MTAGLRCRLGKAGVGKYNRELGWVSNRFDFDPKR